jgi:hypothetical protein
MVDNRNWSLDPATALRHMARIGRGVFEQVLQQFGQYPDPAESMQV